MIIMKHTYLCRLLVAFALSVSVALVRMPHAPVRAAAADLNLKSQSQLRSEAAVYDTAIREITRISSMRLSNPEESKAALAILKKQTPNLRFSRSKLISIGLSDGAFASAINAKAGNDKKSQQQFALQLSQDRKSILQVNGAESLKANIIRSVDADAALLRRVSQQLSDASKAIKASVKSHHAYKLPEPIVFAKDAAATPVPELSAADATLLVIAVAVVVCPPLALAVGLLALNVVAADILIRVPAGATEMAADLLLDLKKNASNDKQQKAAIDNCEDKAYSADDNCETAADKLIFPLDLAASDACEAALLLNLAACLLI